MRAQISWLAGVYTVLLLIILSCQGKQGPAGPPGPRGPAGTNCTAIVVAGGIQVACTDGTSGLILNGAPGVAGLPGTNGVNGHSALLQSYPNDTQCGLPSGTLLLGGVDLNDNGLLENSEVTVNADVCNGATGATGLNGASPMFVPVIVIEPCGHNSSQFKEALLGLSGGGVFGSFTQSSDATTVRNILIPDSSYYDTDASQCNFNISTTGTGRSVTWDGSTHNGSGPFGAGSATYTTLANPQWSANYTAPGN